MSLNQLNLEPSMLASPSGTPSVDPPFRLHDAVRDGKVELVEELAQKLGHGQVDVRDKEGRTPLHLAALFRLTKVATILLNSGADVNARGGLMNQSPLCYAVRYRFKPYTDINNDIDHTRLLLERGAIVDQICDYGTPLFVASKENRLEHARLLISFDANVNVVHNGKSALSVAAECGHLDMVKLLVENGANVNQFVCHRLKNE
ncbi:hypothetical protein HDU79_005874 [Rhizoclosmatium sp. JEL0117]|nr:hypothetical protein HDU79_005874 [Rhizoclosmatium sp. JEL0117]